MPQPGASEVQAKLRARYGNKAGSTKYPLSYYINIKSSMCVLYHCIIINCLFYIELEEERMQ